MSSVRTARYVILDEASFDYLKQLNKQPVEVTIDFGSADINGHQHITLTPTDETIDPVTIAVAGVFSWRIPA